MSKKAFSVTATLRRASLGIAYGLMCLSLNLLATGSVLACVNFLA